MITDIMDVLAVTYILVASISFISFLLYRMITVVKVPMTMLQGLSRALNPLKCLDFSVLWCANIILSIQIRILVHRLNND